MSGPKNQRQIVQGSTYRGVYDTKESNINFAVPSASVLRKMNPIEKDSSKPGLIDEVLSSLSEIDDGNTYKLAVDAKKISRGTGKVIGDVGLFGFEQEKLSEKVHKLAVERIGFYHMRFARRMQLQICK